ncbi:MAG: GTP-binding protein, partial [Snowella sp.]
MTPTVIAVAGPSGSGKTTWISQAIKEHDYNCIYLCPGCGEMPVDLARIGYCYPRVQVLSESQIPLLSALPQDTVIFLEIAFHIDLSLPFLSNLSCHRVAVLPADGGHSQWQTWADQLIPGNRFTEAAYAVTNPTNLWGTALKGQVFDSASLDELLKEITEGAYGNVQRRKG